MAKIPTNRRGQQQRIAHPQSTTPVTPPRPAPPRLHNPPRHNTPVPAPVSYNFPGVARTGLICLFVLWVISSGINCMKGLTSSQPANGQQYSLTSSAYNVPDIRMLPPAKTRVKTKVVGIWQGEFSGDDAVLHVTNRHNNNFRGTLIIRRKNGVYKLAVSGTLAGNNFITLQETKVLSQPSSGGWILGVDLGTFADDEQIISGTGKDNRNSPYSWSFRRASRLAASSQRTPFWRTVDMSRGLSGASTGGGIWYGAYSYLRIPTASAGHPLQVDVQSDGHELRIELWKGRIEPSNHAWWANHEQVVVSNGTGDQPKTQVNPQLNWKAEPGTYTLFFANYEPSGNISHYNLSYRAILE